MDLSKYPGQQPLTDFSVPLPDEETIHAFLSVLLAQSQIYPLKKGSHIYTDGQQDDGIYVLLHGEAEILYREHGQQYIMPAAGSGMVMGCCGLFTEKHASVRCKTPCVVAYARKEVMETWDPSMRLSLLAIQANRNQQLIQSILHYTAYSVEKRILLALLELSSQRLTMGRADLPVLVPVTVRELSQIVQTSREYTSKIIRALMQKYRFQIIDDHLYYYPCEIQEILDSKQSIFPSSK